MIHLAVFASGTGSNARKIIEYFEHSTEIKVALVVSNKPEAGVLNIADDYGIPTLVIHRAGFYQSSRLLDELAEYQIDWLILAGFLWLIPDYLIEAFPDRIVNIHPALLPQYGGKGMYGMHVHEAVKAANEPKTGITIHLINEHYDEGPIIFQATCPIAPEDTPADIAKKVQALEHRYFPEVIEQLVLAE